MERLYGDSCNFPQNSQVRGKKVQEIVSSGMFQLRQEKNISSGYYYV